MKIIDLLNKIANEELRYDVKINTRYEYSTINEYLKKYGINEDTLNVEVIGFDDIIEEENKIPEKIEILSASDILDILGIKQTKYQQKAMQNLIIYLQKQSKKINELIDKVNELDKER